MYGDMCLVGEVIMNKFPLFVAVISGAVCWCAVGLEMPMTALVTGLGTVVSMVWFIIEELNNYE